MLKLPDNPTIPYIVGDGIGRDITPVSLKVIDAAVEKAYGGKRKITWKKVLAGEEAIEEVGDVLPAETIEEIKKHKIAIKGPLTTPVGGGYRSVNVAIRQILDLYVCFRPVRYFRGVPSPLKRPELVNIIVFRENTEDVYAGIEWPFNAEEAKKIRKFLEEAFGIKLREDSGIGIKPISVYGSKRMGRAAIEYAINHGRKSVTIMHKGNIMKYTEGLFRDAIYELAKEEYRDKVITEEELIKDYEGRVPEGKIVLKDRIADAMFQQLLLRPDEYDILVTPNLNGDYISDAAAAQVGGLGMAPGANINFETGIAVFEATHGSAPKYAGKNMANPCSFLLSGAEMLEYIGWREAKELIIEGIQRTIEEKFVTYDLARQIEGAKEVSTSDFGERIIEHIKSM